MDHLEDIAPVAAAIAESVDDAIENANRETEIAEQTAEAIAQAAMESERGTRIETLERRFEEWQSNQADLSEAVAALTVGMSQMSGQLSALLTLQPPPTPNPQGVEDGPRESPVEETPVIVVEEPEAPETPPAPPAPAAKKRRLWI